MGISRLARVLALLLLLAAGGPARGEEDSLVIGITQFPATLHPNIESMLAKSYVLNMTLRPLTHYDQKWLPVCFLCLELPTLENGGAVLETTSEGKEGIAVTYAIHPEAAWGDGTPVTSRDALFTWEVGRHPKSGISNFELYRRILSLEVLDEKRFTLHLDRVTFDYNSMADFRLLPEHIERPIFEADPVAYRERTAFDRDPTNPGLAWGPYRIAAVVPGAEIELLRNPTWYGPEPAFQRIRVRIIENTAALEANLLSGALDMVAGELGFTLDQALAFEARHGKDYRILYKPGLIYEHLEPLLDNPILADVRVRRALLHALDRQAIAEELFGGQQPVAMTSVSPLDWVFTPQVADYPYDPGKAAALLEEAGWTLGSGGIRRNAAGQPLTLVFMTTAGNRARELVQQVLQDFWRAVGIEVRIENQPARLFFGETVSKRRFGGLAMFAWLSSPENVPRTTLHSGQIPREANGWAGQNYAGYADPRMDALIDAIEVELDREKRRALWAELQRLYAEELPALPLYWRAEPYILPTWLSGLEPTGHQGTTTLWVESWRREG